MLEGYQASRGNLNGHSSAAKAAAAAASAPAAALAAVSRHHPLVELSEGLLTFFVIFSFLIKKMLKSDTTPLSSSR